MQLLQAYHQPFFIFLLVLTRLSGLVMTAPLLGSRGIPMQIRAFLVLGMACCVAPVQFGMEFEPPQNLARLVLLVGYELLLGAVMGLVSIMLFSGLQLVGQILGQMSGLQLADVFDPTFDGTVPVYGQLLDLTAMSVFLCLGGHRQVIVALLDSFVALPLGGMQTPEGFVEICTQVLTQSFVLGVRAAAPAMLALLLAILITGFVARTLPQLNVNAIGYGINAALLPLVLMATMEIISGVFQEHVRDTFDSLNNWIAARSEAGTE